MRDPLVIDPQRGEVWSVDLDPTIGAEIGKRDRWSS
jgi:mRNA-degrading endonuclease toxin of MazEF toxin-antitoxin module